MSISFAKDKHNEGAFLLRGLESELVEGETVEVVTKGGKAIKKKVGARRAGPFDDGIVLHEQGGGGSPGAKRAASMCPHCGCDVNAKTEKAAAPVAVVDDGALPF